MALILNIDTALQSGSVCLSNNEVLLALKVNTEQHQQASWVHQAIAQVMAETGIALHELQAVAVSNGPGSYTGLRIGLSTAKGICFALKIPLICINTLQMMASVIVSKQYDFFCPMIDARRMEVFTAVYDKQLNIIEKPQAKILDENSFADILQNNKVLFTGDGVPKFQQIVNFPQANFIQQHFNAGNLIPLSLHKFKSTTFSNLAYTEPEYLKAVHLT